MKFRNTDKVDEVASAETPEDVAVLYSWANLHGAKYRDFSASRREYRAQLRHRAAEQVREQALLAQAEAEAAATVAETASHRASEAARKRRPEETDSSVERSLRAAEEAARTAAAERVEAARRAEAAAVAEAAARREEREIAEAHASAQRQAARYADSEVRRRAMTDGKREPAQLPGQVTDPYTMYSNAHPPGSGLSATALPSQTEPGPTMQPTDRTPQDTALPSRERGNDQTIGESPVSPETDRRAFAAQQGTPRRPQGYRPDDASGVRQIYRGPDYEAPAGEYSAGDSKRHSASDENRILPATTGKEWRQEMKPIQEPGFSGSSTSSGPSSSNNPSEGQRVSFGQRRTDVPQVSGSRVRPAEVDSSDGTETQSSSYARTGDRPGVTNERQGLRMDAAAAPVSIGALPPRQPVNPRPVSSGSSEPRAVSPFSQAPAAADSARGRRAQDDFDYQQPAPLPTISRRNALEPQPDPVSASPQRPAYTADPVGPAWLYAPAAAQTSPRPANQAPVASQSSVADTLQQSRERVAARWFALKGVFEQPGQEREVVPVRQKETRTPVLAVFSLAGGVGKTSLVATVGRSLSSMGEKVLLTDTTSHGLLPFYFGASELRQGTVRTFSPPSGSTDAPIYLVSYDVEQKAADEEAQGQLAEEIINNSRGTHRILLDLNVRSSWIVGRMSRMNPTILVPVAPDMNSVISLQTLEKFFSGVSDGDGRPLQPYYVLNQFDPSLPLHLDVREVMRRQLGDRLLPFVIRRAPAVSEALAEGMTVVDYAPDAAVAEDYMNLATWLRTVAAPATAGFRNVRWSER